MIKVIDEGIEYSKAEKAESTFVRRYIEIEGSDYDHQELLYMITSCEISVSAARIL